MGIKAVLTQFGLVPLPGNTRKTYAMLACIVHALDECRHSRSSHTLRKTTISPTRQKTGWLGFLIVIDGLEIPSMVRNCWAQLASKQFLSCECANGDMKE